MTLKKFLIVFVAASIPACGLLAGGGGRLSKEPAPLLTAKTVSDWEPIRTVTVMSWKCKDGKPALNPAYDPKKANETPKNGGIAWIAQRHEDEKIALLGANGEITLEKGITNERLIYALVHAAFRFSEDFNPCTGVWKQKKDDKK